MGLKIDTNRGSVHSQRLAIDGSGPFHRLSTGLRIPTEEEDAAEFTPAERLRAQVRSAEQARREANDGVAQLKTVEAALVEVSELLERLRRLTSQAPGNTLDSEETTPQERPAAIDHVLSSLAIGADGSHSLTVREVDTAVDVVTSLRNSLDAVNQRLVDTIKDLSPRGGVPDPDLVMETATRTRRWILEQASTAILGQANAQAEAAFLLLHLQGTRKPTPRSRDFHG